MTPIISKAQLAQMLNVSKPRVSQFVQLGMPVRADRQLDTAVVLRWITANIMPPVDGGGVVREARLRLLELGK
jgi:phage terminase Nu1 subunit (DNA packaging protein)